VDLLGAESAAVALGVDEVDDVEGFDRHGYSLSGACVDRLRRLSRRWGRAIAGAIALAPPRVFVELARTESIRQHLVDGADAGHRLEQHAVGGVFVEQLPAPAARHQDVPVAVDTGERDQLAPTAHRQRRSQRALRAEADAIGGVLHVASAHHAAIVDDGRCTHRKLRVRHVRLTHRILRDLAEGVPVDRHDFTYGWPTAPGPIDLPTKPATAIRVTMYGIIAMKSDGMPEPDCPAQIWKTREKPNSRAAADAYHGFQRPRMTQASAI